MLDKNGNQVRSTKSEFVEFLMGLHNISRSAADGLAEKIYGYFFDEITAGKSLHLKGVGSIWLRPMRRWEFIKPQTGEKVMTRKHYHLRIRTAKPMEEFCTVENPAITAKNPAGVSKRLRSFLDSKKDSDVDHAEVLDPDD